MRTQELNELLKHYEYLKEIDENGFQYVGKSTNEYLKDFYGIENEDDFYDKLDEIEHELQYEEEQTKIDKLKMWKKILFDLKEEIDELENNIIEVEYYIEDLENELERNNNK